MKLPRMNAVCTLPYQEQSLTGGHRSGEDREAIQMQAVVAKPGGGGSYKDESEWLPCFYDWYMWFAKDSDPPTAFAAALRKCDQLKQGEMRVPGKNPPFGDVIILPGP
jgi:hypothetical protein